MSEVRIAQSDYVRFVLKSDIAESLVMTVEPEGWEEDELEIIRHKEYHGIFTQFSNSLTFYNEARDYIKNCYEVLGLNGNTWLTKYKIKEVDDEPKWVQVYQVKADYNTMKEKGNGLQVKFNSNDLEELIKAHEGDEFELGRTTSIDDNSITDLDLANQDLQIQGRKLVTVNRAIAATQQDGSTQEYTPVNAGGSYTARTEVVISASTRFEAISSNIGQDSTNFFYRRTETVGEFVTLYVTWDIALKWIPTTGGIGIGLNKVYLRVYDFDTDTQDWSVYEEILIMTAAVAGNTYTNQGSYTLTNLDNNKAVGIFYVHDPILSNNNTIYWEKFDIEVETEEWYESTNDCDVLFVHDAFERMLEIFTGEKDRFVSNLFGRAPRYQSTGEFGLIALIHGYSVRKFDKTDDRYKSMKLSLKGLINDMNCVFNTGMAVETRLFKQILRIEDLAYFYRDKVVIRLPEQISNVQREVDPKMFYSGIEMGYTKGGDYENQIGLDEPNTETSWVTPLRKTKNKYLKKSKTRSDEYGMELIRRKPYQYYPTEDTGGDEHNWLLDLRKVSDVIPPYNLEVFYYTQNNASDVLDPGYPQGVLSPESYRSMLFTPLRMLLRHGWTLRSGLEHSIYVKSDSEKKIKYISSKSNSALETKYPDDPHSYKENEDILIHELDRARVLPEKIKFEHPVNDELIDLILGKTRIIINGIPEDVPNVYFKFEWTNEYGEIERGYLDSLKPKGIGQFEMIKANEKII